MTKVQKAIALVGAGLSLAVIGVTYILTHKEKRWRKSAQRYDPYDALF